MLKRRSIIVLILAFAAMPGIRAQALPAKTLLNAFVASYAAEEVTWRKDIQLGAKRDILEPGRLFARSDIVGAYSFLPKSWDDFLPSEQQRILADPRLRAFLISSRLAVPSAKPPPEQMLPISASLEAIASSRLVINISPRTVVETGTLRVEIK